MNTPKRSTSSRSIVSPNQYLRMHSSSPLLIRMGWAVLQLMLCLSVLRAQMYYEYRGEDGAVLISYSGSATDVKVPGNVSGRAVTEIGSNAFADQPQIKTLEIPKTVTRIADSAFSGCSGLEAIQVDPENRAYSSVDGLLFDKDQSWVVHCPQAKQGWVSLPDTLNGIPSLAFADRTGLTGVSIPRSVKSIGQEAFAGCSGLTELSLPEGVQLWSYAFARCTGLVELRLPPLSVFSSDYTFRGCTGLTTVVLDGALSEGMFRGCTSLTEVVLGKGDIPDEAFYGCRSLEQVYLLNSVTRIGEQAFLDCSSLRSAPIGRAVTDIGYAAFYACTGMTEVSLPDSVRTVGELVFEACTSLAQVRIGKGVSEIGSWSFYACPNLRGFEVDPENEHFISENGILFNRDRTSLVKYPATLPGSYTIPDTLTNIAHSAFSYCPELTAIQVSESQAVFSSVDGVLLSKDKTTVIQCPGGKAGRFTLPASLTGNLQGPWGAFAGCTSLTSIDVDPQNTNYASIDGVVFTKNLAQLVIFPAGRQGPYCVPEGTKGIYDEAFEGATGLTQVIIPEGVSEIPYYGFYGCSSLKTVTFPNSVTRIIDAAFQGCSSLERLYFRSSPQHTPMESYSVPPFAGSPHATCLLPSGRGVFRNWSDPAYGLGSGEFVDRPTAHWVEIQPGSGSMSLELQLTAPSFEFNPQIVRIEASSDFESWEPLEVVSTGSGPGQVQDAESGDAGCRFYRARPRRW